MSQAKVDQRKKKKKTKQQIQRRKSIQNMLWILAGCIIFGGALGFFLGKYWLYPNYQEQSGYTEEVNADNDGELLQEINRQMEEEE